MKLVGAVVASVVLAAAFTAFAVGGQSAGGAVPKWCKIYSSTVGTGERVAGGPKRNGSSFPTTGPVGLSSNDKLTTDLSGHVHFCLKQKTTICSTWENADVTIQPTPTPAPAKVVAFTKGNSQCSTSRPGSKNDSAGSALLLVNDPLWSVAVGAKGTTVGVEVGFIEVSGRLGPKRAVIVGPGQQVFVPEGGDPGTPVPIDPSAEDQQGFTFLQPFLPPLSFTQPLVGDSPTLKRIYTRKLIVVGLDTESKAVPGVASFTDRVFEFLASSWKVKLKLQGVPQAQAGERLASGTLDLFASPQPPASNPIPFFTTPPGTTWQLADSSDGTFEAAVTSFLRNDLVSGQYAQSFRKAFAVEPTYAAVRSILFTL